MLKEDKILITGGSGLVGSALDRLLKSQGFENVLAIGSRDCDLRDWEETKALFDKFQPDYVFHFAARVFGIMGNMNNKGLSYLENIQINTNVVEASRAVEAKKISAMGSGCVYPYPSPSDDLKEEMIWLGAPHPSEDSYAHSKRAMLAQLDAYKEQYNMDYAFMISGNLYGPGDSFDAENGHVIPALINKFYQSEMSGEPIIVWGNGSAQRDFTYSDDAARAALHIMKYVSGPCNLGSGQIHAIRDIVECLSDQTGLGELVKWDETKPNGQAYRAYDLSRLNETNYKAELSLREGLKRTYQWFSENYECSRK